MVRRVDCWKPPSSAGCWGSRETAAVWGARSLRSCPDPQVLLARGVLLSVPSGDLWSLFFRMASCHIGIAVARWPVVAELDLGLDEDDLGLLFVLGRAHLGGFAGRHTGSVGLALSIWAPAL